MNRAENNVLVNHSASKQFIKQPLRTYCEHRACPDKITPMPGIECCDTVCRALGMQERVLPSSL